MFKNGKITPQTFSILHENDKYLRYCKCSTDDNISKSLKYICSKLDNYNVFYDG